MVETFEHGNVTGGQRLGWQLLWFDFRPRSARDKERHLAGDWQIPDPKAMAPEQFREVRDLIEQK
jgi:protein-tyrosine-phosphatase